MKATVEKYPDFDALKAAEQKAQKDAAPKRPTVDLMQSFLTQFAQTTQGKEAKQTRSKS